MKGKTSLGTDKHLWHPSPLLGQIVLVTTLNADGVSNIAPKSWISMMAFEPPILALGCNLRHWTARNIIRSGEFVVNVPGAELAEVVWRCHDLPHPRPVEAAGLTPIPSVKVAPPRVEECRAHLECVLDRHVEYGDEVVLLARIADVSVDSEALKSSDAYAYLRLIAFLEGGTYGVIEHVSSVTRPGQSPIREGR
jgi:flavin reductase (DIM6/NTAB) family NADH-FMN oxidoreductase RutF